MIDFSTSFALVFSTSGVKIFFSTGFFMIGVIAVLFSVSLLRELSGAMITGLIFVVDGFVFGGVFLVVEGFVFGVVFFKVVGGGDVIVVFFEESVLGTDAVVFCF